MSTAIEVVVINPTEYGIEETKANELIGNLPQIQSEREILEQQYKEVVKLDLEDSETSKKARELRLKIQKNRTQGIGVWHKTTKDYFLKGGQFIDAVKRKEEAVNLRMEQILESIEKHAEIQEQKRKAELKEKRVVELELYSEFVPFGIELGGLSDDEYKKVFNGAKLQYEAKLEEERKAEAERKRIEEVQKLHNERKESLLTLWQFVENKDVNFGEMSEELFSSIKSDANSKKIAFESEQERIRKENERLAKEKAQLEAKAKKEREEAEIKQKQRANRFNEVRPYLSFIRDLDSLLEKDEKEYQKELQEIIKEVEVQIKFEAEQEQKRIEHQEKERKEKEELEAKIKAKQEEEKRLELEKLAEEQRLKKEAEKLAKAPIKKQLSLWVDDFQPPVNNLQNETKKLILEKFEAFKKWAKEQVESI